MEKSKKWKVLGKKTVYKGRLHILEYNVELPDGSLSTYEVDHGTTNAISVLIRTPDDKIVLSYQYRFPLNEWVYDLPGGSGELGETPMDTAARECREEVGIEPKHLRKLVTFSPNPGRSDWSNTVFFCDSYKEVRSVNGDPSEAVRRRVMPIKDVKELVEKGRIVDPGLLLAWHTARNLGLL